VSADNGFHLIGRLARDPEAGRPGGTPMVRFTLAVDRYNRTTKAREANFFRVVLFGKRAEFVLRYFTKGSGAAVSGEMAVTKFTD
jgi:single-strand DNA-binding protein